LASRAASQALVTNGSRNESAEAPVDSHRHAEDASDCDGNP
jgi:hypothetical protein